MASLKYLCEQLVLHVFIAALCGVTCASRQFTIPVPKKLIFPEDNALRPVEPIAGKLPFGLKKVRPDNIIIRQDISSGRMEPDRNRSLRRFKAYGPNETVAMDTHQRLDPIITLQGGDFKMGLKNFKSTTGEYPLKDATVKPFKIDRFPVTNQDFALFKRKKMKFITEAEHRGYSFVFFKDATNSNRYKDITVPKEPWWLAVYNASWYEPGGLGSTVVGKEYYPVVHVSYSDAKAFCDWAGKRLPTEYEWEFAIRGGLKDKRYPWGDKYELRRANLWQGLFPAENELVDGFHTLAPVNTYQPQNKYGLYDMLGNVWEWTTTVYKIPKVTMDPDNPLFVAKGTSFVDSRHGKTNSEARCSQRKGFAPSFTGGNVGFRCASAVVDPQIKSEAKTKRPKKRFRKEDTWAYKAQQAALKFVNAAKRPRPFDDEL